MLSELVGGFLPDPALPGVCQPVLQVVLLVGAEVIQVDWIGVVVAEHGNEFGAELVLDDGGQVERDVQAVVPGLFPEVVADVVSCPDAEVHLQVFADVLNHVFERPDRDVAFCKGAPLSGRLELLLLLMRVVVVSAAHHLFAVDILARLVLEVHVRVIDLQQLEGALRSGYRFDLVGLVAEDMLDGFFDIDFLDALLAEQQPWTHFFGVQ